MRRIFPPFAFVYLLLFLAASCEKIELPDGTPEFVTYKIREIKSKPVYNTPAKVFEWNHNGTKFYYFTADCCDQWTELYDTKGTLICHPDGGMTGTGDGKCPDFTTGTLTKTLIWEDNRK